MDKNFKILMLAQNGNGSRILFNELNKHFYIEKVIVEKSVEKKEIIKKRVRKLGYMKVFGQILFMIFVAFLRKMSSNRIKRLLNDLELSAKEIPDDKVVNVPSINSNIVKKMIEECKPDMILVNGTRIISKDILVSTHKPFINTHVGITPKYRGVHGGYWALCNNDKKNCGVTVHLIDEGIDTGEVLYQDTISITDEDNFVTYPYLQVAKAIALLKKAISDVQNNELKPKKVNLESKIWTHPTLWDYVKNRIMFHVK